MNENKIILGIETSDKLCGASVSINRNKYSTALTFIEKVHSKNILPLVENAISFAGISKKDLEVIAVSAGPGSFTGLRIGMSVAKALAYGLNIPLCPVPTHEALAIQVLDYIPDNQTFSVINRLNRDEFYYTKFKKERNIYTFVVELKNIFQSEITSDFFQNDFAVFCINEKINVTNCIKVDGVNPSSIANWCRVFGDNLTTSDFDLTEPDYHREFLIKEKK